MASESGGDKLRQATPTPPTSRLNLHNFDAIFNHQLQAAQSPKAPTHEVVLIVHGTFANPTYGSSTHSSQVHWWQLHGSFAKALDAALERHGSSARCDFPLDLRLEELLRDKWRPRWSGWSGANSEVERRQGAYELAEHLRALQGDDAVRTIHIVAHSHGGNVVRRALRYMNRPTYKLGKVICLGTPFLHFDDLDAWRRWITRVHWPMLIVVAGVVAGLVYGAQWFADSANQFTLYVVAGIGLAALISMWRYAV